MIQKCTKHVILKDRNAENMSYKGGNNSKGLETRQTDRQARQIDRQTDRQYLKAKNRDSHRRYCERFLNYRAKSCMTEITAKKSSIGNQ